MQTEYEATFLNIDKDEVRRKLKVVGAALVKPEFLQKRFTFNLPKGYEDKDTFVRVRDEGDKITLTLKVVGEKRSQKIDEQKEISLKVDNFEKAVELMEMVGCQKKAYQESKREVWKIGDTEITIDEWPFLEPYVEVEGESEEVVKEVSEKLGFDYKNAWFCSVASIYAAKYGVEENFINNHIPKITFDFDMENPFLNLDK